METALARAVDRVRARALPEDAEIFVIDALESKIVEAAFEALRQSRQKRAEQRLEVCTCRFESKEPNREPLAAALEAPVRALSPGQ